MPSQRNDLKDLNINSSKNTRMDIDHAEKELDYRKDEIMHIARYTKGAQSMVDLAKHFGRPIRVLDIGCGQMNTVRLFYKSYVEKKSDIIEKYVGVDIDFKMVEKSREQFKRTYATCNAEFLIQDLTVTPHIDFEDGYFDLIICTEFLEHINPDLSQPIIEEAFRLLGKDGVALFSTPNSNGSNKILPKDHFYEYSYEELIEKFKNAGFVISNTVGLSINLSKLPKEYVQKLSGVFDRFNGAFGRNSAFTSVAIAPLIEPKYCKNVLYVLVK
jgi:SAM-dependent methyltransferase